jgi:hypothetical protein
MGEYIRKYPEAPTPEEVEQGYAPSTIRGTPFVKFLFWTFAGLAITYAISYGSYVVLDRIQAAEDARYKQLPVRRQAEFAGPRLQPSAAHPTVDYQDMSMLFDDFKDELDRKQLWRPDSANPKGAYGRPGISDAAVAKTAEAIRNWKVKQPATQPAADVR